MRFNTNLPASSSSPTAQPFRIAGPGIRLSALALAVMLSTSLTVQNAHALSLGRLNVQSALGEPLSAEIDITDITEAESAALRVGLAPADVYRAAGVEFNSVLASTDIRIDRKADGRVLLRITNSRPITEPYLDLILEANWGSGRIVRDYTMLFDPPKPRTSTTTTLPSPIPAAVSVPRPSVLSPLPPPSQAPRTAPAPVKSAAPTAPEVKSSPSAENQVIVRRGDTASRIANAHKPANASLEQMLVAMLRANPQAFIQNNVNKIKSGAVLDLPSTTEVASVSATEAKQFVATQGRDFNAFRQRLATAALPAAEATQDRKASGTVQAEVKDTKAAQPTPDQLKLTKGAVQTPGKPNPEEKIAQARQAKDTAARTDELSRNITDLSKLNTATTSPGAASTPQATAAPATAAPAPTPPVAAPATTPPTTPTSAVASAPVPSTSTPASNPAAPPATGTVAPAEEPKPIDKPADKPSTEAAQPPAAPPPAPVPVAAAPAPVATEEPSFVDGLLDNPLALPAAGGLIALLAGFGVYRWRQRKKPAAVDSSFLESRLQPDSFFGASGGQSIDTAEVLPTGNSMMYSPSQLDAGGDVDPVAEADVYLAYGRDLQAEEILKEALKIDPARPAVHLKMVEIFAKRRDVKSFEMQAMELYALTQGNGPQWAQVCALAADLSPSNPLFQPGGRPEQANTKASAVDTPTASTFDNVPDTISLSDDKEREMDLDLDFSLDAPEPSAPAPSPASAPEPTSAPDLDFGLSFDIAEPPTSAVQATQIPLNSAPVAAPAPAPSAVTSQPDDDLGLHFDFEEFNSTPAPSAPVAAKAKAADAGMDLSNDFDLHFDLPEPEPEPKSAPAPLPTPVKQTATATSDDNNMLSFDMGDLSLDLDSSAQLDQLDGLPEGDPLETKLSLAAEFLAIGDEDGARSLAEEVLEQATGALRSKAKSFLSNLS